MPDLVVLSTQSPGNEDEHMIAGTTRAWTPGHFSATTSAFLLVDALVPSVDRRYGLRALPWMRVEDTLSLTYHALTL
jgi:hypothetical protein